jgi:hypothetical protein
MGGAAITTFQKSIKSIVVDSERRCVSEPLIISSGKN